MLKVKACSSIVLRTSGFKDRWILFSFRSQKKRCSAKNSCLRQNLQSILKTRPESEKRTFLIKYKTYNFEAHILQLIQCFLVQCYRRIDFNFSEFKHEMIRRDRVFSSVFITERRKIVVASYEGVKGFITPLVDLKNKFISLLSL